VAGLTAPSMPIVKGDQAAACVSAASVLAKVTRDRIMIDLHGSLSEYGFDEHKGYCTAEHAAALDKHGPTEEHRWSYVNVVAAAARHGMTSPRKVARAGFAAGVVQNDGPTADEVNPTPVSRGGARSR
jgi:ribonuclease HII